ncbi:MAG TPA: glycosyl hydrolase family 18 protein [Rhodanobacteraceae bacterium]
MLLFGVLLAALVLQPLAATAQPVKSENIFYMTDTLASLQSFEAHAAQISIVIPATYHVDRYGTVYGEVDPRVLATAAAAHVMVMPIVGSFNQKSIHAFLANPKAQARAIGIMLYDAKRFHYYGWQFDFEGLRVTDRDAYTAFYSKAAKALHAHGFKVSMAVIKADAPVPDADFTGFARYLYENWRGAFDFKKLAAIGDFISFMSYDQNTALTPPGPVAGIPWMQRMAKYLLGLGISPSKISFGIPLYSDHWYATYSKQDGPHPTRDEITYREVRNLLQRYRVQPHWMTPQDVDYAYWAGPDGAFQWLFIENTRSFADKLQLVRDDHFRGFSAWVLGFEDPGIWKVLAQDTQAIHYQDNHSKGTG